MSDKLTIQEWHKKEAVRNFNETWDLIDKKDRSDDDNLLMIHKAHASRFHWGEIGTELNFARGEWQVSRVYALCNMGESALYHGLRSLKYCLDNNIGDFDLAFGYESVARAYKILNDTEQSSKYLALANEANNLVEDKGNKDYVASELATI